MENLLYNNFSVSSRFRWNYRSGPDPTLNPAWVRYGSVGVAGMMWWWVLWHLWHEPDHITGEFPEPNPRLWTDKELGIPQNDEDDE